MIKLPSQPIDVVFAADVAISSGTLAHRRTADAKLRRRSGFDGTAWVPWPACQPKHEHPCAGLKACRGDHGCLCVCSCDGTKWRSLSSGRGAELGAVGCPDKACFGGS